MDDIKRVALIPAYEPGDNLPGLIDEIAASGLIPIVVDDGSGPDFDAIFEACKSASKVIRYTPNGGKGHALKTGFEYIKNEIAAPYVLVTMDSDGQHSVKDALRVCQAAIDAPDSLVLGSRKFEGDVPLRSRFGNGCTRLVYKLTTGIKVRDTQTGLRAFRDGLTDYMLNIEGDRYEYEMNVLLKCTKSKIPIREIDIETIYLDNNSASHFNTVKDSLRIYGNILKFALSSFIGFLVDYSAYSLLINLLSGLGAYAAPVSNVCARVLSAGVNFTINKKFIFKNDDSVLKTGAMYFTLAACILAGNTLLLSLMVNTLNWNKYLSKLVTEVTFFTLSWFAQKKIIFKNKHQ